MNEILNISNVHGYMDKQTGTAYLNAEDVARGFGFTESKGGDRGNEFDFRSQLKRLQKEASGKNETA